MIAAKFKQREPMTAAAASKKLLGATVFITWLCVVAWGLCQFVLAISTSHDGDVLIAQGVIAVFIVSVGAGFECRSFVVYQRRVQRRQQWEQEGRYFE